VCVCVCEGIDRCIPTRNSSEGSATSSSPTLTRLTCPPEMPRTCTPPHRQAQREQWLLCMSCYTAGCLRLHEPAAIQQTRWRSHELCVLTM
jgi:hypothetical protein